MQYTASLKDIFLGLLGPRGVMKSIVLLSQQAKESTMQVMSGYGVKEMARQCLVMHNTQLLRPY